MVLYKGQWCSNVEDIIELCEDEELRNALNYFSVQQINNLIRENFWLADENETLQWELTDLKSDVNYYEKVMIELRSENEELIKENEELKGVIK